MLIIGLTGSIATGKSTVSTLLSSPPYSLPIIDADLLARQAVAPGTRGYAAVVREFGPTTPDLLLPDGDPTSTHNGESNGRPLNRPALGRRVFGATPDAQRRRAVLNGIVHPAVRRAILRALLLAYVRGHWAVVLDLPLLFESGWEPFCGTIIVVGVRDPEIQMRRLMARDAHLTRGEAEDRVRSQGGVREKVERVSRRGGGMGEVLWNDGGREELQGEVRRVMRGVGEGSPRWWTRLCWVCPLVGVGSGVWSFWRGWRVMREWEMEKRREKAKL